MANAEKNLRELKHELHNIGCFFEMILQLVHFAKTVVFDGVCLRTPNPLHPEPRQKNHRVPNGRSLSMSESTLHMGNHGTFQEQAIPKRGLLLGLLVFPH